MDHTLVDRDGRSLDVLIVGRSGDTIQFRRKSDGEYFEMPFAMLSDVCVKLLSRYPLATFEPPAIAAVIPESPSRFELRILHFRQEIEQINRRIRDLETAAIIARRDGNHSELRRLRSEIRYLEASRVIAQRKLNEVTR